MAGNYLPDRTRFFGVAQNAVEEVISLGKQVAVRHSFLQHQVLEGLAEQCFAAPGSHLGHEEILLEAHHQILIDVAHVSQIDALGVQVVGEVLRIKEGDG